MRWMVRVAGRAAAVRGDGRSTWRSTGRASLAALAVLATACSDPPQRYVGTGTIVAEIEELDFGAVFVGESRELTVRIQHRGRVRGALQVRASGAFRVGDAPAMLAPGEVAEVPVVFAPQDSGPTSVELLAAVEGVGEPITVLLLGQGTRPEIEVTQRLDFGPVELGTSSRRSLSVRNLASRPVIVAVGLDGAESFAFEPSVRHLRIPGGQVAELEVTFRPGIDDVHSAILHLSCQGCSRHDLVLSGTGSDREVHVAPERIDFGHVPVGEEARAEILISNRGATISWVASAVLRAPRGSPFTLEVPQLPAPLGASRVVLNVTFRPRSEMAHEAEVRIEAAGRVFEIPLDGRGGDEGLRAEPAVLDLGLVPAGEPAVAKVRLQAVGEGMATVQEIRIDDDPRGRFKATPARQLPTSLRDAPLDVEVVFSSGEIDRFASTLIFVLSGNRERHVPVRAQTVAGSTCDLKVDAILDFGAATVGRSRDRVLRLRNPGSVDCTVGPFALDGSPAFEVPGFDLSALRFLEARGTLSIPLRYSPTRPRFEPEVATFTFGQVHPEVRARQVELRGVGTDVDLRFEPGELLFATAQQGSEQLLPVTVTNAGPVPVRLAGQELQPAAGPITLALAAPPLLPAGGRATLQVRYAPADAEASAAELRLLPAGAVAAFVVPVAGDARATPCGSACSAPIVSCPVPGETSLQRLLHLEGAASRPGGTVSACDWALTSAPAGSAAELALLPAGHCAATFRPDVEGAYELTLTARDTGGKTARCTSSFEARPFPGVWIEARGPSDDEIDLHVLEGADLAEPASWGGPQDCWEGAPRRDFLDPGPGGDAVLDPAAGQVPEVVRIASPQPGDLEIGLHWPTARHGHATAEVETVVWCGGVEAYRQTLTLAAPYEAAHVGTLHVDAGARCTFTPSNTRIEVLP